MIVLTRIDDRLIHGQVVEGWVNFLKATCLLVADDAVAANPLQRSIMEMTVPQGLDVQIGTVAEICERVRSTALAGERAILLFSNPGDVLRAVSAGMECATLNIGGMHYVAGKRKLIDILAVNQADLEALKEIAEAGIKIDVQAVPTQRPVALKKILDSCTLSL
ncbi:MAG TPA: PTS sugar transporter subunit IIB [Nitrospirota bacterium]|nr:PTS sugar transporter subunit IIB [Nitrospirota bacterium]